MPFRFRKSIGITKGIRLNLSKRGPSISFGGKGISMNVSDRGTRTTIGIPGTGISYSETTKNENPIGEVPDYFDAKPAGLTILSLFADGIGLVVSFVSLLGSCILVAFLLYFLFSA